MITRIGAFWERLRASFWFLPAIMIFLAIILSVVMVFIDQGITFEQKEALRFFGTISPQGARSLLSTVAASMISVAGVTFSITLVALAQTSSQYGPRLISSFLRDRGNQIVLGTFIATFLYCLLVLRTIRGSDEVDFVPDLAVIVGILLTVVSVAVLVYFVHHISVSLQAEYVVAGIGQELDAAIERLFPDGAVTKPFESEPRSDDDIPDSLEEAAGVVSPESGYLQAVDYDGLENIALEHDLTIRLTCRAGGFVAKGDELLKLWPADHSRADTHKKIQAAFILGSQRLQLQDVEFSIHQLVEIAVRALSPGINDPFTAIVCIDQLSSSLAGLAARSIPDGYQYDDEGKLRMIRDVITFDGIISIAFDKIRRYGRSNVDVMIRLLEALAIIAMRIQTQEQGVAIEQQAAMIQRAAEDCIPEVYDREAVESRYQLVVDALSEDKRQTNSSAN